MCPWIRFLLSSLHSKCVNEMVNLLFLKTCTFWRNKCFDLSTHLLKSIYILLTFLSRCHVKNKNNLSINNLFAVNNNNIQWIIIYYILLQVPLYSRDWENILTTAHFRKHLCDLRCVSCHHSRCDHPPDISSDRESCCWLLDSRKKTCGQESSPDFRRGH